MDLNLKGKFAVITGGSKGIGYAVAEGLAREGVNLAPLHETRPGCSRRGETHSRIRRTGRGHRRGCVQACRDRALCGRDQAAYRWRGHLINNAGTGTNETIMDAPDEKWDYFWNLHVMAAVFFSPASAPDAQAGRRRDSEYRIHLCQAAAVL